MAARARHGSYLFKRPESSMWWLRLRSPGKVTVQSLRTADKLEAEMRAAPMIARHKGLLLAHRPVPTNLIWRHDYAPGLHDGPDGGKVFATETELHYIDKNGRTTISGPHGMVGFVVGTTAESGDRPSPAVKNADDEIFEVYIRHANLNAACAKACRDIWHLFVTITGGKRLKDATRDDGRALVAAMGDVKSATAKRKLAPLRAAVNLAISEGKHSGINPFVNIVGKRDDSEERISFTDEDMVPIRAKLHMLGERDQLLVRLLACTGMRLAEAFGIDSEKMESGVRYVVVAHGRDGTTQKTKQSHRRLPLPKQVIPYLPEKIGGPLFVGEPNTASKRLGGWLRRDVGITDPNKVIYSLRHRAKDRLRIKFAGVGRCPEDLAEEIFGREKITMGDRYGGGSPIPDLQEWIDRIGFGEP